MNISNTIEQVRAENMRMPKGTTELIPFIVLFMNPHKNWYGINYMHPDTPAGHKYKGQDKFTDCEVIERLFPAPASQFPTKRLNSGRIAYINPKTGHPYCYANKTQAERRCEALTIAGEKCHVSYTSPFYIIKNPNQ